MPKQAGFLRPRSFFEDALIKPTDIEQYREDRLERRREYKREYRKTHPKIKQWVGIDGEGITLGDPRAVNIGYTTVRTGDAHRYISMCYRDANNNGDQLEDRNGLTTKDCLEFILSIPDNVKIAAYGFGYDQTKIVEDLPDDAIWRLTHPSVRAYKTGHSNHMFHHPVEWYGYALDHFNTKFKVGKAVPTRQSPNGTQHYRGENWRTIDDLIRFYQCAFVKACKLWKVGTPDERNIMREMKADRRNLVKYTQEQILDYSNKECQWLAILAQKLDDACEAVGIDLNNAYFGAGSLGKALLKKWDIKSQLPKPFPEPIAMAASSAYFGGRFELSRRGVVKQPVNDWDISSAYPYQIYQLPCLKCGEWTRTTDRSRVDGAQAALVRYSLRPWKGPLPPWGPFPFRDKDGSIPFPIESSGGWMHKDEYLIGEKLWPNVKFHGAWVYETNCNHRPFKDITEVYLERMRIGKEGPGIVLKLGANAIAGNIMQTIGTRPYYNVVWAGMITSGTRAQLLEMLGRHEKWSDVLMMATDGLWSLSKVNPPIPIDTGTDIDVLDESTGKTNRKPLGGWEHNLLPQGVFMARPGIYIPLGLSEISSDGENEKDDDIIKDVKARGIGVKTMYKHRDDIIRHYHEHHAAKPYVIEDDDPLRIIRDCVEPIGCERFVGLRGGIVRNKKKYGRRKVYGIWTLQRRVLSFDPMPKREQGDGPLFRDVDMLRVRKMPTGQLSAPYDKMRPDDAFGDKKAAEKDPTWYDDDQPDWSD